MLSVGDAAPSFELTSDADEVVRLAQFQGKRVLLYFYPKADTPGCTQQACALRDLHPDIDDDELVVIGISPDPPEKLAKFRAKYDLPFVLLSDPDHAVAAAYGAWGKKSMYGKTYEGVLRTHAAIDRDGRIVAYNLKVKPLDTAVLARDLAGKGEPT